MRERWVSTSTLTLIDEQEIAPSTLAATELNLKSHDALVNHQHIAIDVLVRKSEDSMQLILTVRSLTET